MGNPKELRKQLRNVVQDLLPDLIKSEFGESVRKELHAQSHARLDELMKNVQAMLKQMDDRSKDIQGYLVRQSLKPAPVVGEAKNEETKEEQK